MAILPALLNSAMDHVWHVWINRRQDARRRAGEPWELHLYSFKNMLTALPGMNHVIRQAFTNTLPAHTSGCALCHTPEPIRHCKVTCALGVEPINCEILGGLKAVVDEYRAMPLPNEPDKPGHWSRITDDDLYSAMALTCAWHLLMSDIAYAPKSLPRPQYVDWVEGAIQTTDDRLFWNRVYENMGTNVEADTK
jgi:hypothetical protein